MIKIYYLTPEVKIARLKRRLRELERFYQSKVDCNNYYLNNRTLVGYPKMYELDFLTKSKYVANSFVFDETDLPYSQELINYLSEDIERMKQEIETIASQANIDSSTVEDKINLECMFFDRQDVKKIELLTDDGTVMMKFQQNGGIRH